MSSPESCSHSWSTSKLYSKRLTSEEGNVKGYKYDTISRKTLFYLTAALNAPIGPEYDSSEGEGIK